MARVVRLGAMNSAGVLPVLACMPLQVGDLLDVLVVRAFVMVSKALDGSLRDIASCQDAIDDFMRAGTAGRMLLPARCRKSLAGEWLHASCNPHTAPSGAKLTARVRPARRGHRPQSGTRDAAPGGARACGYGTRSR